MPGKRVMTDRIQSMLALRGMSRQALARSMGVSSAAITRYLNGGRRIRPDKLWAIARALGVDEAYLTGETDEPGVHEKDVDLADAIAIINRNRKTMTDADKVRIIQALFKDTSSMPFLEAASACPTCPPRHSSWDSLCLTSRSAEEWGGRERSHQ